MKRSFSKILLVALFLVGCTSSGSSTEIPSAAKLGPRTLNVFAAASLTDAFTEISRKFEASNPDVKIIFNFAGSQALRTQIEEGAPADIFASANQSEMDALVADDLVKDGTPQVFLSNQLVMILPGDNPAGLDKLEDLADPGIKLVLAAEERAVKARRVDLPVVLLTGWADHTGTAAPPEAPVDRVLAKPVPRSTVLAVIAELTAPR